MITVMPQVSFDELAVLLEQQAAAIALAHGEARGEASAAAGTDNNTAWRRADLLWPSATFVPSTKEHT